MSLPQTVNRVYVNGMPVDPADLNDLQEQTVIARSKRTRILRTGLGTVVGFTEPFVWNDNYDAWFMAGGGAALSFGALVLPIPMDVNDRLHSYSVVWGTEDGGASDLIASIRQATRVAGATANPPAGAGGVAGSSLACAASTNIQRQQAVLGAPILATPDTCYSIFIAANGPGLAKYVFRVEVEIDRLVA